MSLIEIAIVIALIAVLMALSLPMFSHANAEARSVVCRQNLAEIGGAVNGYVRDYGKMPHLVESPAHAHEPGTTLAEFVGARLKTPNVAFCPGDETERSAVLGTSYHWATAYNDIAVAGFDRVLDQPLVTDREAFHLGADRATNELMLRKKNGQYQLVVTGTPDGEV